jgi:hypothetical protein
VVRAGDGWGIRRRAVAYKRKGPRPPAGDKGMHAGNENSAGARRACLSAPVGKQPRAVAGAPRIWRAMPLAVMEALTGGRPCIFHGSTSIRREHG